MLDLMKMASYWILGINEEVAPKIEILEWDEVSFPDSKAQATR